MKTETGKKIVEFIRQKREVRADELIREFNLSRVAIHRQLKKLVEQRMLRKTGRPPLVFYLINQPSPVVGGQLPMDLRQCLDDHYLYITAGGEIVSGALGFQVWLKAIGKVKELESMARHYQTIRRRADDWLNRHRWIDATAKLKPAFGKVFGRVSTGA